MLCFYFPPSNKPRRTFACLIARATLRHVARLEPHAGFVGGERVTFLLCTIRKHQPARRTTMDLSCAPGPLCWSSWHDAAVCHRCPNIHRFKRTRAVCVRLSKTFHSAFFLIASRVTSGSACHRSSCQVPTIRSDGTMLSSI